MLLESLVEQVEQKFPAVAYKDGKGSRAAQAAELVRKQQVTFLGEQGGRDYWNINGHTCSIKGGCDCLDNAPTDPNGRKLCKHRLAVMFVRKMQDDHGIAAILRKTTGDRVVLTVQVLYADNGEQYTLNSYRADGVETVLEYDERIRFTEAEFAASLRLTGWGMPERRIKISGLSYRYILRRGVEMVYNAGADSAEEVERKASNKRFREIAVAEEMDNEFAAESA